MTITKELKDSLNAEVKILFTPEDYKPEVDQELKKQAKKANLPGFRPGKVPMSIIRKYVGKQVLLETLQGKIGENLQKYIEEEKLKLVGGPMLLTKLEENELDTSCQSDVEFVFELGLEPHLDLNLKLKKAVPLYEVKLDDSFYNDELEENRKRYGKVDEVDTFENGDIVYGTLKEVVGEGEEGFSQMIALNSERIDNAKFFKQFKGKKTEDSIDLDIFQISKDEDEIAKLTFIDKEQLSELKDKKTAFEIKKINRTSPAELNDEFFRSILGAKYPAPEVNEENVEEVNTEEGSESTDNPSAPEPTIDEAKFSELYKELLQESLEKEGKNYFTNKSLKALLEANPIDLPADFLKKWLIENNEQITEDNIEEQYTYYENSLRQSILSNTIFDKNPDYDFGIEDVKDNVTALIEEAMPNSSEAERENLLNNFLSNEEYLRGEMSRMGDKKMGEFLMDHYKPSAKSINASKFFKMVEKEAKDEEKK